MVGLIDCDNFFCSCERVFRPDLEGRPVVVLSNNDGCVVARSAEAKAMGIPEGLPYYQLCERYGSDAVTAFSSNYTLYADMSSRVMSILRREAPDVIQYSIDEAFLDLEGIDASILSEWGRRLCRRIQHDTGMPVSLGIAPTRTLAKLASRFAKRYPAYGKCCLIDTEERRIRALQLTAVGDVWGIGRRISARLAAQGIATAYAFAMQPRQWVRSNYHLPGERTYDELNGYPRIDVDGIEGVTKKTIVTSRSFPDMISDIDSLIPHVANYAARCAAKLRRQHTACGMISVFIQSNHFRDDLEQYDAQTYALLSTATDTTPELVEAALGCLHRIYRPGIYYKRAGCMVAEICPSNAIQPDLFAFDAATRSKLCSVSRAIDNINGRMGADTVVLGAQQYRIAGDDGRSIRFVNAIRRARKSPDYTTRLGAFVV